MNLGILTKPTTTNSEELIDLIYELTKLHINVFLSADKEELTQKKCDKILLQEQITQTIQEQKLINQDKKEWLPWFPVIDRERCTNCMQCLSFCLFDVYGVDKAGNIAIKNASNCKTNCPACSRVCPEVAIVFPKYRNSPINGDVVKTEDINREKIKIDISSLLGGDIYNTLRARTEKARSRFSKERDEDRALRERKKCLVEIQQKTGISQEILESLPNMEQIQNKVQQLLNQSLDNNKEN